MTAKTVLYKQSGTENLRSHEIFSEDGEKSLGFHDTTVNNYAKSQLLDQVLG